MCIVMYARIVVYAHDVTYERIPSIRFGATGTAGGALESAPGRGAVVGRSARALR